MNQWTLRKPSFSNSLHFSGAESKFFFRACVCVKQRRDRINAFALQNDSNKQNRKHSFFKQKLIQRGGNRNAGTIFRLAKLAVFGYIEWKTWFHQPNYSTKIYNGQNDCMKWIIYWTGDMKYLTPSKPRIFLLLLAIAKLVFITARIIASRDQNLCLLHVVLRSCLKWFHFVLKQTV